MPRKPGNSRLQFGLFATPLEEMIAQDNLVRVVDAFVNALDLQALGFRAVKDNHMGASSYDPCDLLKIYFYGYLNRIRSSRRLEMECRRNVELMWLIRCQTPGYHTISTFRTYEEKDKEGKVVFSHRKALVGVFRAFNKLCDELELFGKTTFAIDGTKIAAQNSKKKHLSEDKINRKLDRLNVRLEEYMAELDNADLVENESAIDKTAVLKAMQAIESRKTQLAGQKELLRQAKLEDPHLTQISLTDPDARMLPINNEGLTQVAYNVQSVVDDKHCLIADFSVENQKDLYFLSPMAIHVKKEFGIKGSIEVLADKGYHSGKGLQECAENNIATYVAFPEQTYRDRPKGFRKEDFQYDPQKDVYICPNKKELKTKGTLHEKHGRQGHLQTTYKLYRSSFKTCSECPFKEKCLSPSKASYGQGRTLERSAYEEAASANKKRIIEQYDKYKRRQTIVEHPFGTIKRSWGFHYTLLKGKEKVSGEMAIVFTTYNLRRVMSIIGVKSLLEGLKRLFSKLFTIGCITDRLVAYRYPTAPGSVIISNRIYQILNRRAA